MENIGIIGNGFVGDAINHGMKREHQVYVYDELPDRSEHDIETVISKCDIVFVCVPTPSTKNGIDLSYINNVFEKVSEFDTTDKIFVIKSTVIPGTCDMLAEKFNVNVVMNPEFLTERFARKDFLSPRGIIIGGKNEHCQYVKSVFDAVYEPLRMAEVGGISDVNYVITSSKEAEMIKYVTNCFFATKVTIMNEFYNICEAADIDYNNVIKGALADGRIFPMHTDVPGHDGKLGYGGKCFPKDMKVLGSFMKEITGEEPFINKIIQHNCKVRE
jgi:nucleotide sugar dehydrogenase